jgi:hypothetical protein
VKWSKFHAEDPLMLGATIRNSFSMVVLRPGFLRPWLCVYVVQAFITYCRQTQTIQNSYSRNLVGLHNKCCISFEDMLSPISRTVFREWQSGGCIAPSWQVSGYTTFFFTQNIIKVQDSNGVPANQGLEKIRASFKSWNGSTRTHTHTQRLCH